MRNNFVKRALVKSQPCRINSDFRWDQKENQWCLGKRLREAFTNIRQTIFLTRASFWYTLTFFFFFLAVYYLKLTLWLNQFILSLTSLISAHFICRSNFFKNSTDNTKHVDHSLFRVSSLHSILTTFIFICNGECRTYSHINENNILKKNIESKYLNDWKKTLLLITLYPLSPYSSPLHAILAEGMKFLFTSFQNQHEHHRKTEVRTHLGARGGNDK